jgi:hypothetical protein
MNDSVTISSVNNTAKLTFSNVTDDEFNTILEGKGFSGSVGVSCYHSGFPNVLFDDLAANWKGWDGEKKWSSLEGELHLSAKTDQWGHIFLNVLIHVRNGYDDWDLSSELSIEPGQLDTLAKALNILFSKAKFQIDA